MFGELDAGIMGLLGALGLGGPAIQRFLNNNMTQKVDSSNALGEQNARDIEHLKEQMTIAHDRIDKKENESGQAIKELEQRIEKRFDEHKQSSRADHEKLERKIDQVLIAMSGSNAQQPTYQPAPPTQEQWRPSR